MKAKEEEECGNKVGYSNGHNLLIKDLVKKKKKNKEVQAVKYKECRKNHAAKIGRYAVDGCCEFIAAGEDRTTGSALRCAACDCHRNFHRREIIISISNSSSSTSNSV